MDPNKAYLPWESGTTDESRNELRRRADCVERAVRAALAVLNAPERLVIEGYYFDGRSFPCLANESAVPLARVRTIHARALGKLRRELASFVAEVYGLHAAQAPNCAICLAPWRDTAERLLDEKTPEMTWGELAIRMERATGWQPSSPQIMMTHQRKHRRLQLSHTGDTP